MRFLVFINVIFGFLYMNEINKKRAVNCFYGVLILNGNLPGINISNQFTQKDILCPNIEGDASPRLMA